MSVFRNAILGLLLCIGLGVCWGLVAVIAAADGQSEKADDRTEARLKALQKSELALTLYYSGDQDKPMYRLTLYTGEPKLEEQPFHLAVKLTRKEADLLLDALAADGFLRNSMDVSTADMVWPRGPCYIAMLVGKSDDAQSFKDLEWQVVQGKGHVELFEDLSWGLPMMARLDTMRKGLTGDAAAAMDRLIGRLSGFRQQWEQAPK